MSKNIIRTYKRICSGTSVCESFHPVYEACSRQILKSAICSIWVLCFQEKELATLRHDGHLITVWFYWTPKFATVTRKADICTYFESPHSTSLHFNQFLNKKFRLPQLSSWSSRTLLWFPYESNYTDGGSMFLRNIGTDLSDYTASHPKKYSSSSHIESTRSLHYIHFT
jgi:hypothetical protein